MPYKFVDDDKVNNPTFGNESSIRRLAKRQTLSLHHLKSRWKHTCTSLQECHETPTGYGATKIIAVGNVVLV